MSNKRDPDDRTNRAQKVDPSVNEMDLYQNGEPRGSVPLERTMRKPEAYKPSKPGPK